MGYYLLTTISGALREAKEVIEPSGPYKFICIALTFLVDGSGAERAKREIERRLSCPNDGQGRPCAERWLNVVHGLALTEEEMFQWRHAWLDQLIAEFEAKGD